MAALWANNVKLRHPQHKDAYSSGRFGRYYCQFGARLAMGCNLAAFFTGIPQFSLHAWFLCCCYCYWLLFWCQTFINATISYTGKTAKVSKASPIIQDKQRAKRRFSIGDGYLFAMIAWSLIILF